jgi:Ca2+-binding RTX toxin-like protein
VKPTFPNDPLFPLSWHLLNTGQLGGLAGIDINVLQAWEHVRGGGIRVAVVDDGVDPTVPDLAGALAQPADSLINGLPLGSGDDHGTSVAGLIAARGGNGIGSLGVAPEATIISYKTVLGSSPGGTPPAQIFADALARDIPILNNSWGAGPTLTPSVPNAEETAAVAALATEGRGGLGGIVLFANGNSRTKGFGGMEATSDFDARVNDKHVIAVAAVLRDGEVAPYSTPGANLLVAAPAGDAQRPDTTDPDLANGVLTTDRSGTAGYTKQEGPAGDVANFDGTSAATPIVAGVVALMLDANPRLGLRDVKEILAITARRIDADDPDWVTTATPGIDGGAMAFSRDVGFGLVDASAAVRLAETWGTPRQTAAWDVLAAAAGPAGAIVGSLSQGFTIAGPGRFTVERVELTLHLSFELATADGAILRVNLTSPSGTTIRLMEAPATGWRDEGVMLGSPGWWGEAGLGAWTLSIDVESQGSIGFNGATLRLHGDDGLGPVGRPGTIFTDGFARNVAADPGRAAIGRVEVLNAAATSSAMRLDLARGEGVLAGVAVQLEGGTRRVLGGGGGDRILGALATEDLRGGWGSDTMAGRAGADSLDGDAGDDLLRGGDGNDLLRGEAGDDLLAGGAGQDSMLGDAGADTLRGGGDADLLLGLGGDDHLSGGRGADSLLGDAGSDTLTGDVGADTLLGGDGADLLLGGADTDRLQGGEGRDTLRGGHGSDLLQGEGGDDLLVGDAGDDALLGGQGNDRLVGGTGDDVLEADAGDDTLRGGDGADMLFGGAGNDLMAGGDGADLLVGGDGADTLIGGAGPDVFVIDTRPAAGLSEQDVIIGLDTADLIDLTAFGPLLPRDGVLRLIGEAEFGGVAGEIRLVRQGSDLALMVDLDGDAAADLGLQILATAAVSESQLLGAG